MADQHAAQIRRLPDARIVATCDAEPLMARQLAERLSVSEWFTDVDVMLTTVRPDVVHVTTPPQSHLEIGKQCLEANVNVYMEKPFTLNTADATELIGLAERKNVKITAGHNGQFTHAMVKARQLVAANYLGGQPVHLESMYCYEFGDPAYAKALLGDSDHWVRSLPGSLLQNIISHGVSRIAEFMPGDQPTVLAARFTSAFLKGIGHGDIIDELRLVIKDECATTAYFTFSSQISPSQHQFRLYGPKRSLLVDDDHQIVTRLSDVQYKSYLRYLVPPIGLARQCVANVSRNVANFVRGDFHLPYDAGLFTLIAAFYRSIRNNDPPPIPYREILLTSRIMDAAFDQLAPDR